MTLAYAVELGLTIKKISVTAPKINGSLLETYDIALTRYSIQDNLKKIRFFEETFLLANTSIKVVLEMPFLFFNNADIKFVELEKLIQRTYIATKALSITSWVKLIDKKGFAKAALDENFEKL